MLAAARTASPTAKDDGDALKVEMVYGNAAAAVEDDADEDDDDDDDCGGGLPNPTTK